MLLQCVLFAVIYRISSIWHVEIAVVAHAISITCTCSYFTMYKEHMLELYAVLIKHNALFDGLGVMKALSQLNWLEVKLSRHAFKHPRWNKSEKYNIYRYYLPT